MFGIGRSSASIYNELSKKALSVASVQEIGDSSIRRVHHRDFNPSENYGSSPISFFRGNVGKMSDGLHVRVPQAESDSLNILTSVVLQSNKHGEISASHNRFGNNRESAFIFINGSKVPDSSVIMYTTDSHTNFIIPRRFFKDEGDNSILIEKRKFEYYKYGGTFIKDFTGDTVSFGISAHRDLTVNNVTAMLFLNGEYMTSNIESISYNDNRVVTIKFINAISGDLEVFIDSSANYSVTRSIGNNEQNIPYYIDDTFIDPIYGPINRDNCMFFLNGKRINNENIDQKARLNFNLEKDITSNDKFTLVFSDSGVVDIKTFKLYADDYYLYNFLGTDKITEALLGYETETVFDENIDFETTLNSSSYTYDNVSEILKTLQYEPDVHLRIQKLLRKCPYLIKPFLEIFSSPHLMKKINYNGTDEEVIIGIDTEYNIGSKVIRIISVNGVVAKIDEFVVTHSKRFWNSTVDSVWFNEGENEVEIIESISNNDYDVYKVVEVDRYETTNFVDQVSGLNYEYRAVIDVFGGIDSIDDFKMLAVTKREFDPDGIYFDDSDYGFRIVHAPKMIVDGKIYISFGAADPRIDMLVIMNVKHHTYISVSMDEFNNSSYESIFNSLHCGVEKFFDNNQYHDVKVPIVHTGSIFVFNRTNGSRLFKDIDFIYKNPNDSSDLRSSGIALKRQFEANDIFDIIFIPEYTSTPEYPSMSVANTFPNKYGLLYLGELKFPYSPKYVKLYANNKGIMEKDIDILSNKLIRLYDTETVCVNHNGNEGETCPSCIDGGSLYNIFLEFNFRASFAQLEPFISEWDESDFEREIARLFGSFDISNSTLSAGAVSYNEASSIYETFDSGVDSNGKTPNPVIRGGISVSPRYNLYLDAFLRWFISDRSNHVLKSYEDLPENILKELEIFIDESRTDRDILIDCSKTEIINDIELATKPEWYKGFTVGGTIKNFLDCCVENGLSVQECFERYEDFKHSNRVFKEDLLPISALDTFEGEDILIGGI